MGATLTPYDWAQDQPAETELDRRIDALIERIRRETEALAAEIARLAEELRG